MRENDIFLKVMERLHDAEVKHPVFAIGPWQAVGYLSEEHGEVCREVTKCKDGWEERMDKELIDLIVISIRMLRRDYEVTNA